MSDKLTLARTLEVVDKMRKDGWCEGCKEDYHTCIKNQKPLCLYDKTGGNDEKSV